jgi:hypothetical protein
MKRPKRVEADIFQMSEGLRKREAASAARLQDFMDTVATFISYKNMKPYAFRSAESFMWKFIDQAERDAGDSDRRDLSVHVFGGDC